MDVKPAYAKKRYNNSSICYTLFISLQIHTNIHETRFIGTNPRCNILKLKIKNKKYNPNLG
jgi:hypothetical protein